MKANVWTIAGSDSSGGAGMQADLKVFQQFNTQGCSIITAITAQNMHEVNATHYIPPDYILAQIKALKNAFPAKAIKLGMLGRISTINAVHDFLKSYQGPVILDPVMLTSSHQILFDGELSDYIKALNSLFPYVDVLTPNLLEAKALTGLDIESASDIKKAADFFLVQGVKSVLIKGGHSQQASDLSQDYWTNGNDAFWLAGLRYPTKNYHGSGCILSAALAASLALGYELKDALVIAKMYVSRGIRLAETVDAQSAFIAHGHFPESQEDLPFLDEEPIQHTFTFPDCGDKPLGLYPVVDSSEWLAKLLPLGINTIQLRIKDKSQIEIEDEIKKSVQLANQYQARLFINDYWQLAIRHGAYGVHLGQEDLKAADMAQIQQANLRLGISTHSYYEVAQAHRFSPSYLACGPIFPTTSKSMSFAPQGLLQLARWRRTLRYSLVAIGGIGEKEIADVMKTGVGGVALISAITKANKPHEAAEKLLRLIKSNRSRG